jgi:hypothetical protein
MKNIVKIITAFFIISITPLSAYTRNANTTQPYSAKATKGRPYSAPPLRKATKGRPTYYRGYSDGLQNYPGKTIDAGMNTGMLPTNSASHSGNDVSF